MANTIRIKRRASGVGNGAPSGLANAELAYNEGDNILYYGYGTGGAGGTATQAIAIAGSGAYLNKNNNLSDLNNTQTSRNNLASSVVTSGYFMRGNGTNVLMGNILASDVPTLNQNTTGNAGSVTNGVYTSRTITPGSGLAGSAALDLSADRTFNIGQGDGISVSADAIAVDSTVVRTTGNQSIGGQKTFSGSGMVQGAFKAAYSLSENYNVIFSPTQILIGQGDINVNLGGNAYYDPNGVYGPTKEIANREYVTSTLSGITFTAGSGLVNGGTLVTSRTFDIGQGDGISVSDNAIAVDSTVVRTTGTQTINGSKTFGNQTTFTSGIITPRVLSNSDLYLYGADVINLDISNGAESANIGCTYNASENQQFQCYDTSGDNIILSVGDRLNILSPNTAVSGTYFPVFTQNPNAGTSAILSRTASQLKGDIGLSNVTNDAQIKKLASTSGGFVPTWNDTTGDALNIGYSVETTLTGGTSAIPRADAVKTYVDSAITSGFSTNDAMVFKGTLGSGGTVTALPTGTVSAGWSYRVITAGTYAGVVSEVGDLIIAVADAAGNVNSTWTVVQTNIDGAVVGPASSTTNALAVFNGTTGKLIQNSSFVPTTVGGNLINLTNPGAIRFVRINADNTVSSLSDTDFRTAIGAGTVTSVGGTGSSAGLTLTGTVTTAGSLTLGGTLSTPVSTINDSTTVGQNLVKLTNPSAIRFLRINANNTVDTLTDSDFRTAIGAGTSSTVGTVTSVAALTLATTGTDLSSSVANGTTTPTITLSVPTASSSVRGALSSGDWSTFNNKAAANQTMFIGTTSVAINRSSAALVLTGITSIDGNAATVTNGVYTTGAQTIAGAKTLSDRPVLNSGLSVLMASTASSGLYFPVFTSDPSSAAQALSHRTPSQIKSDIGLGNAENTALSTWVGSTNITTLGTVTTGSWSGTNIAATKGGTGQSSYAIGDLLYADTTTSLAKLAGVATGNVLLAGGVSTAPSWGKINLTSATHVSGTLPVANGGTSQTSYTDGQLLIGNSTGNTLTKATLTQGSNVTITNGNGSITIASTDTNTATASDDILDGSNTGTQITYAPYATNQAANASPRFYNTADNPSGSSRLNVSAYFYATRLYDNGSRVVTASTICADAGDCTWDGGSF